MEPLSESELRVLRYLPTNLTGPEIAGELYVSRNTVKAHVATCTPSSVPIAGLRRSPGPGTSGRSHPPPAALATRSREVSARNPGVRLEPQQTTFPLRLEAQPAG